MLCLHVHSCYILANRNYKRVLDCIALIYLFLDSPNPHICETTDYATYVGPIMHAKWERTAILFCAVDFSQQQRANNGHSRHSCSTPPEYPTFTLPSSVAKVLFRSTKRDGHDLSQKQSLGRVNSLISSDLRKTLSSQIVKVPLQAENVQCSSPKRGAWHRSSDSSLHSSRSAFNARCRTDALGKFCGYLS